MRIYFGRNSSNFNTLTVRQAHWIQRAMILLSLLGKRGFEESIKSKNHFLQITVTSKWLLWVMEELEKVLTRFSSVPLFVVFSIESRLTFVYPSFWNSVFFNLSQTASLLNSYCYNRLPVDWNSPCDVFENYSPQVLL